jgi:hypothetical protein
MAANRAVVSSIPSAKGAPRSCPAGLVAEVGLRWWRRDAAKPNGGSMSKSAKKRTVISSATSGPVARPAGQSAADSESKKADPGSKQSRVIGTSRTRVPARLGAAASMTMMVPKSSAPGQEAASKRKGLWVTGGRHLSYSRVRLPTRIIPLSSRPQTSNNIIQKGLAFVRERSGSTTVPDASRVSGSCPAGCMA